MDRCQTSADRMRKLRTMRGFLPSVIIFQAVAGTLTPTHTIMKPNIGTADRTLRILVGLGLIAYGIVNHSWIGAIGAVPLLTAFIRFCPLYAPLGISTCGKGGKGGCGGGGCGCQ
jgi:hypothetical protein